MNNSLQLFQRPGELMAEWTAEQAMRYLEVSRTTLYSLVKQGHLTKHRHAVGQGRGGRRTYFDSAEVKSLKGTARNEAQHGRSVTAEQIEQVLTTQLEAVRQGEKRGLLSASTAYSLRQTLWAVGNGLGIELVTGDEQKLKPKRVVQH
jgi:hypothetical protein